MKNRQFNILWIMAVLAMVAPARTDDDVDDDPTEEAARVISLEKPDQSLDTPAPISQFLVPDGEDLWKRARTRAYDATSEHGGGYFNWADLVGEGFRSAKKFQTERYAETESGGELQYVIAADEAVKDATKITMVRMRLVYFIGSGVQPKPGAAAKPNAVKKDDPAKPKAAVHDKKPADEPKAAAHKTHKPKDDAAKKDDPANKNGVKKEKRPATPGMEAMPIGGRVVITAPNAIIDTATNEGLATGNVTVEVFEKAPDGGPGDRIAVMNSDRMRWRTWGEAAAGSTELALYSCSEKAGELDPVVTGKYFMKQPDGTLSTMVVEGRGMVYETGTFDRPNEVADEDGRIAGLSTVSRNRAVFHNHIRMDTTASTMSAIMPFQPAGNPNQPTPPQKAPAKPGQPPPLPSRTIVTCDGPAEFDMAAVPRKKVSPDATPTVILLGRRFDFLNHVYMKKVTQPDPTAKEPAAPEPPTEMSCLHLRIQYPPGALPSPTTFPEYSEAVGGVTMDGVDAGPPPVEGVPPAVPAPFKVSCDRLYFDGGSDNLFLVGTPTKPAEFNHAQKGDGSAQQLCYRRLTQTVTMPSQGPKRMVIRPDPTAVAAAAATAAKTPPNGTAAPAPGGFSLGTSETIITWNGPLSRELVHLPLPGAPDRVKEILLLHDNVQIEQPTGGLKMRGGHIRVVRSMPDQNVEFIEGIGAADASLGQLQAKGEHLTVDMAYGADGQLTKNITTVIGSRARKIKSTLFMEGSAIRSDKFIIDRVKNTFVSFGGAVAVVRNAQPDQPPPTTPDKADTAAGAKGLIKDISFDPGGTLYVQCDGEFSQDGATNTVTIRKNVIIRQPGGLRLLADNVFLTLQDPAPPAPADATPGAKPAAPAAPKTPAAPAAAATPANGLFNGDLKSIDCRGTVEVTTNDQFIQCDRLFKDVVDDKSLLEVNDPDNDVRVYLSDDSGSRLMSVKKSLMLDGKTGTFSPGGLLLILPFRASEPAPRDKDSSPARRKAVIAPEAPLPSTPKTPAATKPVNPSNAPAATVTLPNSPAAPAGKGAK